MFVFLFLSACFLQIIIVPSANPDNVAVETTTESQLKIETAESLDHNYSGNSSKKYVDGMYINQTIVPIEEKNNNKRTVHDIDLRFEESKSKEQNTASNMRFINKLFDYYGVGPEQLPIESVGQTPEPSGQLALTSPESQQLGQIQEQSGQITLMSPKTQQSDQIHEQTWQITLTTPKSQLNVFPEAKKSPKNDISKKKSDSNNSEVGIIKGIINFFGDNFVGKRGTRHEEEDTTQEEDTQQEEELPILKTNSFDLWTNETLSMQVRSFEGEDFVFRIIKGTAAALGDVPYMIGFAQSLPDAVGGRGYAMFCGGTLVKTNAVLTAAHCFHTNHWTDWWCAKKDLSPVRANHYYAVADTLSTLANASFVGKDGRKGQWRLLRYVKLHPEYVDHHDIAVAFTYKPFEINTNVAVIPIASVPKDYDLTCKTAGFGSTKRLSDSDQSEVLRTADLRLLTHSVCAGIHGTDRQNYVCTSDVPSDVAEGDSGGPLVCKDSKDPKDAGNGVVVGVTRGYLVGVANGTLFTRVTSYQNFITQALASNHGVMCSLNHFCYILCLMLSMMS